MMPRRPAAPPSNGGCLPALLLLASLVPLSVIHGATLMKLWEWFVADGFGAPEIGLAHAIGLASIVTALIALPRKEDEDRDPWETLITVWVWRLGMTATALVEGLILSRWVG